MKKLLNRFLKLLNLKKKEETRNDIIIKWADEIVLAANHLGQISRNSLLPEPFQTQQEIAAWRTGEVGKIRSHVIRSLGDTKGNLDIITNEMISYLEGVKNHLLSHRYIQEPQVTEMFWKLSEKGELMKELGGHFAYQKYRKSEIKLITNQGLIYNLLILATFLAAIMPFLAIWIFPTRVSNNNIVPQQVFRPDIRIDSVWLHQQVDDLIQKKVSTLQQPKSTK